MEDKDRRVVLLDIDGVLQPTSAQDRHKHDMDALKRELAEKYQNDAYLALDKYDVGAVYYDWDKKAVECLRKIVELNDAEIVIQSDWRTSKSLDDLKLLFHIYDLDKYITGVTPLPECDGYEDKTVGIDKFLKAHPDLTHYVMIDDRNLGKCCPGHFVDTYRHDRLTEQSVMQATRILKYGPWFDMKFDPNKIIEYSPKNVIFLDFDGVLNDEGEGYEAGEIIIDEAIRGLLKIIRATDAEIVFTSSRRITYARYIKYDFNSGTPKDKDMAHFQDMFGRYHMQIADITPVLSSGPEARPLEIRSWLSVHPNVENFVILDDETFWKWDDLSDHVITTLTKSIDKNGDEIYYKGMTMSHANKALEILGVAE